MIRRFGVFFCALLMCVGLCIPVAAEKVIFVALNDRVLPLKSETMPIWVGGVLYAPASLLSKHVTGIDLGTYSIYNESEWELTVHNMEQVMIFNFEKSNCYDYNTGKQFDTYALVRNGEIYIPIYMVCDFLGLSFSMTGTSYGDLLRIKSDRVILTDRDFIDAAGTTFNSRLKEYNQSISPTSPDVGGPTTTQPTTSPESELPAYFGVRHQGGEGVDTILTSLQSMGCGGLFFFTPEDIASEGALVRWLLGEGNTIGIIAEGETAAESAKMIAEGNENLASAAYTTTTMILCPEDQQETLAADGWVIWRETTSLIPEDNTQMERYGTALIRALNRDARGVFLTVDDSQEAGDALMDFILQLRDRSLVVETPLETNL